MIVYIELQISLALSCMLLTMNHETDEENEYLVPLQTLHSLRCIGMDLGKDIEDWVDCRQVLIEEEGDNILHLACDRGWCGVVREVIQHRKEDIINVLSTPSDPELPQVGSYSEERGGYVTVYTDDGARCVAYTRWRGVSLHSRPAAAPPRYTR